MEDVGNALNPLLDLGQVEGGFVFGLGLWTSEEVKYDPNTSELLTVDTWVRTGMIVLDQVKLYHFCFSTILGI